MLLNIQELAVTLGTTFDVVRDWHDWGVIPAPVFVGGFVRWRKSDIDTWVADGCPQSPAPSEADSERLTEALCLEFVKKEKA